MENNLTLITGWLINMLLLESAFNLIKNKKLIFLFLIPYLGFFTILVISIIEFLKIKKFK
jgi:hypothetical protein